MISENSRSGLHLRAGQRVGLLGGSFDPPHAGHVHITREALKRFGLDAVIWIVSPGNPLKTHGPAPMAARLAACRAMARHPRVTVSDVEARLDTRFTAQTIRALQRLHPGVCFLWLMGADNLAQFHRWDRWRQIVGAVPIGVLARPGNRISARMSRTARIYRHAQLPARSALALPQACPPAWCFLNVPMTDLSSSTIRAGGGWIAAPDRHREPGDGDVPSRD